MSRQAQAGTPSQQPGWPARSGAVPPLADCFSPRPETGLNSARDLAPGATVVLTQPFHSGAAAPGSLSGMGGTGKTQLAAALARSLWGSSRVDLVAWVPAGSRDAVITGYAQAAIAAGLHGADADLEAADRFLAWLASTGRPWLVVLDDLADQADLDGLWPAGPAGLALITTRLPAADIRGPGPRVLEVGRFSPREALSYLAARLNEDPSMRAGAVDLATEVGCLPLGLAQAAALIADSRIDCARYRTALADRKEQFPVAEVGDDAVTVAAAWSLALDRADFISPPGTAGQALALVALLGAAGIPGAVLTSRAACDYICGPHATGTLADESQARGVLDVLARVGLVTIDPQSASRTVLIHGLVQATIQQAISAAGLQQAGSAAADALLQAWPPDDGEPLLAQAQRDCAASLDRAAPGLLWAPEAHPVLLRAGQSLNRSGLTSLAIPYWQALITASQDQDRGRAIIFPARDHLAAAFLAAGHTDVAVSAYEQNLTEQVRALGADHPAALRTRSSLARALLRAGREGDAIALFERALADRQRTLGPDHPDILASRGDLVDAYLSAGRTQAAVAILERTYGERAAALGPGHPDTLAACAELAAALQAAGQLKESVRLHERLVADREQAMGATHPDTMSARTSLAYAYRSAGRLKQALPAYERTLADREKVLGPDHPDTLTSVANLASAYHSAHRLKQAIPLYEEALARHERRGGPDNAETLVARGNLASAYHSAGRLPQAILLYEQTLHDYERLMGPDHANTLTSRANLASAYHTVGRRAEAIGAFEHTLADCERVLPADHPVTQAIRENLQAIE